MIYNRRALIIVAMALFCILFSIGILLAIDVRYVYRITFYVHRPISLPLFILLRGYVHGRIISSGIGIIIWSLAVGYILSAIATLVGILQQKYFPRLSFLTSENPQIKAKRWIILFIALFVGVPLWCQLFYLIERAASRSAFI